MEKNWNDIKVGDTMLYIDPDPTDAISCGFELYVLGIVKQVEIDESFINNKLHISWKDTHTIDAFTSDYMLNGDDPQDQYAKNMHSYVDEKSLFAVVFKYA